MYVVSRTVHADARCVTIEQLLYSRSSLALAVFIVWHTD